MIKCPNCGKPAGEYSYVIDTQVYVLRKLIFVYITYKCECGRKFITKSHMDRKTHEKIYKSGEWCK